MGRQVNSFPRALRAGDPYIVLSSTSGSRSAILRAISKLILLFGMDEDAGHTKKPPVARRLGPDSWILRLIPERPDFFALLGSWLRRLGGRDPLQLHQFRLWLLLQDMLAVQLLHALALFFRLLPLRPRPQLFLTRILGDAQRIQIVLHF